MDLNLFELIQLAQTKDEDAILHLMQTFNPLINKLSKKLNYEDAKSDVILEFIKLIYSINMDKINNVSDPFLISYISRATKCKSIDLFKKNVLKLPETIELNLDIISPENTNIDLVDKLFIDEIFASKCITDKQKLILKERYINDFSDYEISQKLHISRQAVNCLRRKALENIRSYLAIKY